MTEETAKPKSKTITIKLLDGAEDQDGREYKELTFRKMKAGDALEGENEASQTKASYLLYARLAGVHVSVIEDMTMDDLERVSEGVIPLLGKSAAKMLQAQKSALLDGAT